MSGVGSKTNRPLDYWNNWFKNRVYGGKQQDSFGSAGGGIIQGGQTRLVGELGPEIITVGSTSRITPNNQLDQGRTMVPVVIPIQVDGREIARVADKHLYWAYQTAPATTRR